MAAKQHKIRNLYNKHSDLFNLFLVWAGMLAGLVWFADRTSYGMNLWTEIIGAGFTFLILDRSMRQLDEIKANKAEKERFVRQMNSKINAHAVRAVEELDALGYLRDGSLEGVFIHQANLESAMFQRSELPNACFQMAKLKEADLSGANLHGAIFLMCDLTNGHLGSADLSGANLTLSNLYNCQIAGTDFRGADLTYVNLRMAQLETAGIERNDETGKLEPKTWVAQFDETTTLPDGSKWTPETDMTRFTNPEHPDFWEFRSQFK